jgi:hypothetical protein
MPARAGAVRSVQAKPASFGTVGRNRDPGTSWAARVSWLDQPSSYPLSCAGAQCSRGRTPRCSCCSWPLASSLRHPLTLDTHTCGRCPSARRTRSRRLGTPSPSRSFASSSSCCASASSLVCVVASSTAAASAQSSSQSGEQRPPALPATYVVSPVVIAFLLHSMEGFGADTVSCLFWKLAVVSRHDYRAWQVSVHDRWDCLAANRACHAR